MRIEKQLTQLFISACKYDRMLSRHSGHPL